MPHCIVLHFILLERCIFLIEGKNLHQQKDYDLIYYDSHFIGVV